MGLALHRALHDAVSNDDLYIVCNALSTTFLLLLALKQFTVMKSYPLAQFHHKYYVSVAQYLHSTLELPTL